MDLALEFLHSPNLQKGFSCKKKLQFQMEKENRGLRIHYSLFSSTLIIPIFSVFILLIFILVDQTVTEKKMGKRFKGYTIFSEQKKSENKKKKNYNVDL